MSKKNIENLIARIKEVCEVNEITLTLERTNDEIGRMNEKQLEKYYEYLSSMYMNVKYYPSSFRKVTI